MELGSYKLGILALREDTLARALQASLTSRSGVCGPAAPLVPRPKLELPSTKIKTESQGLGLEAGYSRSARRYLRPSPGKRAFRSLGAVCGPAAPLVPCPKLELPSTKIKTESRGLGFYFGGGSWIRTSEVSDNRFTVCPLWPLGNSPLLWSW